MQIGYLNLARSFNLYLQDRETPEGIRRVVHHHLENCRFDKPWLLIYDNVESSIPYPSRGGYVLMTSTKRNVVTAKNKHEISSFSQNETNAFIISYGGNDSKPEDLQVLYKDLQGLPLLLGLSLPFIQEWGLSIFIQEYKDKTALLQKTTDRYPTALEVTWQLRLSSLQKNERVAYEWILLCSYLAPDNIPKKWIDAWLMLVKGFNQERVQQERIELLSKLQEARLLRYDKTTETCSIHNLLQATIRKQPEEDSYAQAFDLLYELSKEFNEDNVESWSIGKIWVQHVVSFVLFAPNEKLDTEKLGYIYLQMGQVKRIMSEFKEAHNYYLEALTISDKHENMTMLTAASLNDLGYVNEDLGNYLAAIGYHQRALAIYTKLNKRFFIAVSFNNLGAAYYKLKELNDSLFYHEQALTERLALGDAVPLNHLAASYMNVGICYRELGQLQKANLRLMNAKDIYEKLYGPQAHPELASILHQLGILFFNDDPDKASYFFKKSLTMYQQLYPEQNEPDIASVLISLGNSAKKKDSEQALDYFNRALEMQRALYPDGHLCVVETIMSIGTVYHESGQLDEAMNRYKEALKNYNKLYPGQIHAVLFYNMGNVYFKKKDFASALKFFLKSLQKYKEMYEKTPHIDTASLLEVIGHTYIGLNNYTQAVRVFESALEEYKTLLLTQNGNTTIRGNILNIQRILQSLNIWRNFIK